MIPKIRIVTDSSCDLSRELLDKHHISVVPLSIRFGSTEYPDSTTIGHTEFWALCAASPVLPETAAPSPGAFVDCFTTLADHGATEIICIMLSKKLSGTMQSAQLAATDVGTRISVHVIDSQTVSMGVGLQCLQAAEMAEAGVAAAEIVSAITALQVGQKLFAALDTLDNLKKGGRIGGAQAMLGSLLAIKPVITVGDGVVEQDSKQRTRGKALEYLKSKVAGARPGSRVAICHGDAPDIEDFVAAVKAFHSGEIVVSDIGAVIGTHSGPRVMAVFFDSMA